LNTSRSAAADEGIADTHIACSGDVVASVPDFAPRADLPAELLPYFSADPSLGIVQSPQYFRTTARMSWMERGAGAVQELFYRLVQVCRDRHDGAICVGSCAMYRRAALDDAGPFADPAHTKVLKAGRTWKGGGMSCTVTTSSATCKNKSGHGFTITTPGPYKKF